MLLERRIVIPSGVNTWKYNLFDVAHPKVNKKPTSAEIHKTTTGHERLYENFEVIGREKSRNPFFPKIKKSLLRKKLPLHSMIRIIHICRIKKCVIMADELSKAYKKHVFFLKNDTQNDRIV